MRRVDVHAHLVPHGAFARLPDGMRAVEDGDEIALELPDRGRGRGAFRPLRHLAEHEALQRDRGVDLTLIGPWIDMVKAPLDPRLQLAWCRVLNDELAAAQSERSRFLAALPDLDGGAAAEELDRAMELGAVGGMLAANPEVGTLARPDLAALWERAERLGAPLVLHPGEFRVPERLREFFLVNLVGNPYETTLAAGALMGARVPERFGDLRVVLVHGGGFLPYQYGRLEAGFARRTDIDASADHLRWFHYDTVLFADPPTRYLLDLVGPERVLAGSDCPFMMSDHRPFASPERLGLSDAERAAVLGGNAARVFGL